MSSSNEKQAQEKNIESLKLELVGRKVEKSLTKRNNYYLIDDEDINYLEDCLNLSFDSPFSFKELMLVINLKKVPKDHELESKDVLDVTINGINNQSSDIIILEPLENQIENINKIEAGTTKLKPKITLSSRAVLLVKQDYKLNDEILNNYLEKSIIQNINIL